MDPDLPFDLDGESEDADPAGDPVEVAQFMLEAAEDRQRREASGDVRLVDRHVAPDLSERAGDGSVIACGPCPENSARSPTSWTNRNGSTTSGSRPLPSGLWNEVLDVGASYTRTFDTPGTFSYFCVIHIGQNARVTVNP